MCDMRWSKHLRGVHGRFRVVQVKMLDRAGNENGNPLRFLLDPHRFVDEDVLGLHPPPTDAHSVFERLGVDLVHARLEVVLPEKMKEETFRKLVDIILVKLARYRVFIAQNKRLEVHLFKVIIRHLGMSAKPRSGIREHQATSIGGQNLKSLSL